MQPNISGETISFRFWILLFLTGCGAGVAAGVLMMLLRAVQHAAYGYRSGNFLLGVEHGSIYRRIPALFVAGVFAGVVLYFLRRITGEAAEDLSDAIWHKFGQLPAISTIVRAVVSIVIVGLGVSLGREGALKQAGGVVAGKLSDWAKATLEQRRLLVACGAGAGMAAAYNVPFGGAVFILEALLGTMALPAALAAVFVSSVATAVSWLFLPDQPAYIVSSGTSSKSLFLWAIPAGPVAGLASVLFVRAVHWATAYKPQGCRIIAAPIVLFTALGAASMALPELLGNGKNVVQLAYLGQIGPRLTLLLLLLKPLATVVCLRSGAPGGLFTPTMTFGALLGAVLAHAWSFISAPASIGDCAILGSAAVLAASTQAPISSVVFVLELTHHVDSLTVPLLIAVAGATITARAIGLHSVHAEPGDTA